MLIATESRILSELNNLPEAEYPAEVTERWEKIAEIADLKIATGELVPQTVAEFAAEFGLKIE